MKKRIIMRRGVYFIYILLLNAILIFSNGTNLFAQSNKRDIKEYSFPEQTEQANIGRRDVKIEVVYGTNLDGLVADFELSKGANAYVQGVLQESGVTANDFTDPVIYTVVAEDGISIRLWTIKVSVAPNTEANILSYSFEEQTGPAIINNDENLIEVEVIYGSDIKNLIATFELSDNATAKVGKRTQTSGETRNDFTEPITYEVTAEDEDTQIDWEVIVSVADNINTDFLSFSFNEQTGPALINPTDHSIDIEVEYATDIADLISSFTLSEGAIASIGSTRQESGITPNDFTNPVTYTITAMDGETIQDWLVTVSVKYNNQAEILTYSFPEQTAEAVIDSNSGTIDLEVVYTTDITNLVANFTLSPQGSMTVGDTQQISGETTNDFSSPIVYTVAAGDGTTKDWIVTVTEALNSANDILSFSLPGQAGIAVIDVINRTVTIELDYTTELEDLVAAFMLSPQATASVDGVEQESGVTPNDFTNTVIYSVTSGSLQTDDWEVTVTVLPNNRTDFIAYSFTEQTMPAIIDTVNHTIKIEVEYDIDLTDLIATFTLSSQAIVYIGSEMQESGVSINDFSNIVSYNVRSGDGTNTQEWDVEVNHRTPSDSTTFLSYSFEEQVGSTVIDTVNKDVYILVAEGTSLNSLVASFEISTGAYAYINAVPQESGVSSNDFSQPLEYDIIAEDGITEQAWLVYVSTEFDFNYLKEPLTFPVSENIIQASVNVPNYEAMDKVDFFYRKVEDRDWIVTEVVGDMRIFSVDITREMIGKMGIYYYFDATDTTGNKIELEVRQLVLHYDEEYPEIPNLRFGETVNQYQIVGIPFELINKNAGVVFDELGEYDIKKWRLFRYNNDQSLTNEYNKGFTNIEPGLGYWLIVREEIKIDVGEGYTVKVDSADGYKIDLKPGWNQIGNPFDADISWDNVRNDNYNLNIGRIKLFFRDSISEGDLIPKFRGGFVFLSGIQPITVNVRPNRINTLSRKQLYVNEKRLSPLDNSSWITGLKISNGVITNTLSGIGMHPDAEEGKDLYDEVLLPIPQEIVPFHLAFNHPEEKYDKFSLDVVPTNEDHIWEFEVKNYGPNKKLTLSWDNRNLGDNEYQLLLNHKETEIIIDMKVVNSYSFNSSETDQFRIVFGNESFIKNGFKPQLITFGNGYPNPFNDHLTIPFTLPESKTEYKVNISIYDLNGKRVKEVINRNYPPGYYKVNWNQLEETDKLERGIYIIQMMVQSNQINTVITRKLVHQ